VPDSFLLDAFVVFVLVFLWPFDFFVLDFGVES
jgi:hypothetical protein